nr:hypothetical protein HK105_007635 [Polyrhizophydium stewartii]
MGCCINFMDMTISFTKNGILLGVAFRDFLARARDPVRLFPCVGLRTPGEIVEANFGQRPFKFDITQYCREERAKFRTAINASPLVYPFGTAANPSSATASAAAAVAGTSRRPPTEARIINSIVLAYMIHHGYSQTASAFHRAAFGGSGFDSSDQMAVVADLQDAPALIPDQFSGSKSIQDRQNIQRLIVDGDIDAAISEISRLYPALFKQHPVVRFQLDCLRFTGAVEASAAADSDAFDDDDDEFYDAMDVEDGHSGAGPPDSISGADGAELMDGAGARIGEDAPLRVGGHAANNNGLHLTAHAHGGLAGAAAPHSRAASSLGIVQLGQQLQRTYGDVPDERVRLALNETFALVCYPHPRSSPLAHLLGAPARKAVASVINDAILGLESLPQTPALETLVRQTFLTRDILVSEDVGAASFLDPERELLS